MQRTAILFFGWLFILLLVSACDPWFAYSPYEANVDERDRGQTARNLAALEALDTEDRHSFKVALLSDPHYHYRKLGDAIRHINDSDDYAFAIVASDLTENGLKQEFLYFHQTMGLLKIPYLTVLGNHDYLANGERVYEQLYGPFNYTFVYNHVKFVMFDNNTIESEKQPDLNWLAEAMSGSDAYAYVIPVSHIPMSDPQTSGYREAFHSILVKNGATLSVHGHRHHFSAEELLGDGVRYLTVSSPQKRSYTALTISDTGLTIEKIEF